MMKNGFRWFKRVFITLLCVTGAVFLIMMALAATRIPFDAHRWLGTRGAGYAFHPDAIVMLGGSGMPSESNLIRLYYTAELARVHPAAVVYIAHPADSAVLSLMTRFLKTFGVPGERIRSDSHGNNTREQAVELLKMYPGIEKSKIVLVTSPENMYRSVRTFRKAGMPSVGGKAAFENAMFVELGYSHREMGGSAYAPDVSENLGLRYNFWNYLKLEITCLREYAAIAYYKMNGWM